MKYLWIIMCLFLTSACVNITPGGDSSASTKLMIEFLKQQKKTESPSVLKVDALALASMTPEQIKALSGLAQIGSDAAINAPKNTDEIKSTTGMDSMSESSETESMLWKGLGALVLVIALFGLIIVWKWFTSTPLGQLLSKSGNVGLSLAGRGVDYLQDELDDVLDRQRDTHDASELHKLKERENVLRRKQASK